MLWRVVRDKLAPLLLFFTLPAIPLHAAQPLAGSSLVVEGLGRGTAALDGQWQFRLGDDPAWSLPTLDDTRWEHIRVDRPWGDQGHYGYTGFAWYRRHVDFVQGMDRHPRSCFICRTFAVRTRCIGTAALWVTTEVCRRVLFFALRLRRHSDSAGRSRVSWQSGLDRPFGFSLPRQ